MSSTAPLRAIEAPAPLRKQVVGRLREAIMQGHLKPGERLRERELCEMLGVSRTSLREGLVELESEGLIQNVPNKAPVVTPISIRLAEEIYQLRGVLEALGARLFARQASAGQIEELRAATDEIERVYASFEASAFLKAKARFYEVLMEGAGNQLAAQVLRGIHARVSQLRVTSLSNPSRTALSIAEIRRIVDAVAARDEEGAWRASTEHVASAAEAALEVLRKQQAPEASTPNV
ncbi:MAG TPA: GntR family transcriptional regulator [Burkholderiales bacterium]|nr:GntR family transcriptional regulator [Burkholderiales bacterium]